MKNSALQLAKQIVNDNKEYIVGNVAEYMIQEVDNDENNFFQYLTDAEIEEIHETPQKWNELGNAVYRMLSENFNYEIEKEVIFSLEQSINDNVISYYVLTDSINEVFSKQDAFDFLETKVDANRLANIQFIEEDESVASYYNYKTCLIYHFKIEREKKERLPKNPIIRVIYQEMKDRGHNIAFLARELNTSRQNLDSWFYGEKSGVDKLAQLLDFYNLDIVKIKKYRIFEQLINEAKANKEIS